MKNKIEAGEEEKMRYRDFRHKYAHTPNHESKSNDNAPLFLLGLVSVWVTGCAIWGIVDCLQQKRVNGHAIECIDGITYFVGRTVTPQVDQNNKPVLCNF